MPRKRDTGWPRSGKPLVAAWVAGAFLLAVSHDAVADVPLEESDQPRKWAVTLYGGVGTDGGIEDFPGFQADFNDAYMAAAAVSRELTRFGDQLALEVEAQAAQHFVKQDHTEGNLLVAARWVKFPWDDFIGTSIAVGEGISYASSIPTIERERSPDKTAKLLNYLMFELELAPPGEDEWSFVTRIHHRSGVFGTYSGVSKGSNFLAFGVKRRF